jgi:hypothetical protein
MDDACLGVCKKEVMPRTIGSDGQKIMRFDEKKFVGSYKLELENKVKR